MKDLIERQAIINKLEPWLKISGYSEGELNMLKAVLYELENTPSAQSEQRWIPCSEKLPESIKPVIITWRNNDPKSYYQYIVGKPFIGTGHYCKGKWFWYSSTCEDLLAEYGRSDVDEVDEAIEVIAWMPLPEVYKEE